MKKIVISLNAFKGCLSSSEANKSLAQGIRDAKADVIISTINVSDGGDGMVDTFSHFHNARFIECDTFDALMRPIKAKYIILPSKNAIIEMALASGLTMLQRDEYNVMQASTYGTGVLIADAMRRGCRNITIGIGGSATNDGGLGMLQAIGYQLFDKNNEPIGLGCGANMIKVARIDSSKVSPYVKKCRVTVACDVNIPFYGPPGAACLFARQKGANEVMVDMLDRGLTHLATIYYRTTGKDISYMAGSGAAGGIGGALMAFLNAKLKSGSECVLDNIHYDKAVHNASLIITGEGQIDKQTLMGKIPHIVLKHGINLNIPVIAVAGRVCDRLTLLHAGYKNLYEVSPTEMPLDEAMQPEVAKSNLVKMGHFIAEHLLKTQPTQSNDNE